MTRFPQTPLHAIYKPVRANLGRPTKKKKARNCTRSLAHLPVRPMEPLRFVGDLRFARDGKINFPRASAALSRWLVSIVILMPRYKWLCGDKLLPHKLRQVQPTHGHALRRLTIVRNGALNNFSLIPSTFAVCTKANGFGAPRTCHALRQPLWKQQGMCVTRVSRSQLAAGLLMSM
jgi:hypothetical protein